MRSLLVGTAAALVALGLAGGGATASSPSGPAAVAKRLDLESACPSRVTSGATTWFSLAPDVGDYRFECRYGLPSENVTRVRISIFWVPPDVAPGRVVSGDCKGGRDRRQGSGGWLSGDRYLSVISLAGFDDRDAVLKKLLDTLEARGFALRCGYAEAKGSGKGSTAKTVTRSAPKPRPGGSTPRWGFPVSATSTSATVVVSGPSVEDVLFTGMAVAEKARRTSLSRLEKLEGIKRKVEANCLEAFYVSDPKAEYFRPALRGELGHALQLWLVPACERLLTTVQRRIDEVVEARGGQPTATGSGCQARSVGLVATEKGGSWTTKAVANGVTPRVKASCKGTKDGFRVDLRATGKHTLRDALGPKLQLRLRRSEAATPRAPGERITVRVTQR